MNDDTEVAHPLLKWASAAGAWGLGHSSEIASILAALYTLLLIADWFWKRWWKPFLINRGVIKALPRPYMSETAPTPLEKDKE